MNKYAPLLTDAGRIKVDLHVHSIRSDCGQHTILELAERANKYGLSAIAVTDHGPAAYEKRDVFLTGKFHTFTRRMEKHVDGLRLFKGIEANLMDSDGLIDLPHWHLESGRTDFEIILLGMHDGTDCYTSVDRDKNTEAVTTAFRRYPYISAISHPGIKTHPVHLEKVAEACGELGIALELNSANIRDKKTSREDALALLRYCRQHGLRIFVDSDAHTCNELGDIGVGLALLDETDFPVELIVNRSLESAEEFIAERRAKSSAFFDGVK